MSESKLPKPKPDLAAALNAVLTEGSFSAVAEFLLRLSPAERSALAKPAMVRLRQTAFRRRPDGTVAAASGEAYVARIWNAAQLAVFATNPYSGVQRVRWEGEGRFSHWTEWRQQLYRLVAGVRPSWLDAWAELLLRQSLDHWAFVRRMVRDGYCRKPAIDEYTLGMMREVRWRFSSDVPDGRGNRTKGLSSVQAALLADPELLAEDLWRIFEIEGTSECNLQSLEPANYGGMSEPIRSLGDRTVYSWRYALVSLAGSGRIARDRLLDASLAALARGFQAHRAGWFIRLHDELEPTMEERTARLRQYQQLLGSPNPNTVTFAFETILALDEDRPLRVSAIATCLPPVFMLRSKSTVKAALAWVSRLAEREPAQRLALHRVVASALLHEATDVQAAVLRLLETAGDPADAIVRQQAEMAADAVSATLRPRLVKWLRGGTPPAGQPLPSAARHPETAIASQPDGRAAATDVVRIGSFDELLDRAAYVLAHPFDLLEAERVMDGLPRFGRSNSADDERRLAPLRQQVEKWRPANTGSVVAHQGFLIRQLLRCWTQGDSAVEAFHKAGHGAEGRTWMVWLRVSQLVRRLRPAGGSALPMLSLPSCQGWWITPTDLVLRLQAWEAAGTSADAVDFAIALLRLAQENRLEARQAAEALESEAGLALRYALGDDRVDIGPTAALWVAAARARDPFGGDARLEARHPDLGPDAGVAAAYSWRVAKGKGLACLQVRCSPALPRGFDRTLWPVALHAEATPSWYQPEFSSDGSALWLFTFWPACREPMFASAACWLANAFNAAFSAGAAIMARCVFEHLAAAPGAAREMAVLAAALGLMCKDNPCRGLASEAVIELVRGGRMPAASLSGVLCRLVATPYVAFGRLAQSLGEIARVSSEHARFVAQLLEGLMRGDSTQTTRDLVKLLTLWRELQAQWDFAVKDPEARACLAALSSGQPARLARQLLSHPT